MSAYETRIRVYYEDTDAGGVIYHANYLKFFERARTDFLRFLGFSHQEMRDRLGIVLMIKEVAMDYMKPARLDDVLLIRSRISEIRPASLVFEQETATEREPTNVVCKGSTRIFCMHLQKQKPVSLPPELNQAYIRYLECVKK